MRRLAEHPGEQQGDAGISMNQDKPEVEWNAAQFVVRRVGQLGDLVRQNYMDMRRDPSPEHFAAYYDSVMGWYPDSARYVEEEDKQKLEEKIRKIHGMMQADSVSRELQERLEELDERLGRELVDLGLDIPSKTRPDPDEAWG